MTTLRLDRNALMLSASFALAIVGCNPSTNMPPGTDGGGGHDAAHADIDSATPAIDSGIDAASTAADTGIDSATPAVDGGTDAGCVSTMSHCNTCVTPATDPLNACSSYVTNCIAFDNTRVPGWPDHIPAITP